MELMIWVSKEHLSIDVLKRKLRKKRFCEEILLGCAHVGCAVLGVEFGVYTLQTLMKGGRVGASREEVSESEQRGGMWRLWQRWGGGHLCTCQCVWFNGPHFLHQCEWELISGQSQRSG